MSDPNPSAQGHAAPARPGDAEVAEARRPAPSALDRAGYARAINRGYGEAMSRGLELMLTLVIMGGVGWLIDRAAGTSPLFTVIISVVGFAGISVKLWLGYDLEMREHEDGAVWNRKPGGRPDETMAS